jgi:6-phosphogluconolactonase
MGHNAVRMLRLLGLAALTAALLLLPSSAFAKQHAKSHHHRSHHSQRHDGDHHGNPGGTVYAATNDPNGNGVIVFHQNRDGTLTQGATVPTGGAGLASEPPFTFPIVDSSGSIALANHGRLLFVVNAGDNTITSFQAGDGWLRRVDRVSAGGILPISLTTHGNLLYVVNEMSSSIHGFYFSDDGRLWPIPGSAQVLSPLFPSGLDAPGAVAAQIGFSPDGSQLVVTDRGVPHTSGTIDTFKVNPNGTATLEQALTGPGVDPNPFGFSFTNAGQLLTSNVGQVNGPINYPAGNPPIPQVLDPAQFVGSASSYTLSSTGTLTPVSSQVASGGRAACWLVLSKDGKFAFVTNTLSTTATLGPPAGIGSGGGAITTYSVASNGTLTRLGQTDAGAGDPSDEAVSSDGRFLFVSVPTVSNVNTSHIDVFAIKANGGLTPISVVDAGTLPGSLSGIAAS